MNKLKGTVITFEDYHKRKDIGSSRIRAFNICKKWNEAGEDIGTLEPYKMGMQSDFMIFQKVYWVDFAKAYKGFKILDMCDPDFLHWGYPIKEMIENVDVITVSSPELETALKNITHKPVYLVNDGILIEKNGPIKEHYGPAKTVVWYGYAENFPLLDACIKAISDLKLDLIVISSKPYIITGTHQVKLTNYPWSANWQKDIVRGDIVLNPTLKTGKWAYKSNNKTTQAWALNMPVAGSEEELRHLINENNRKAEADKRLSEVLKDWTTEQSVIRLKDIIKKHYENV